MHAPRTLLQLNLLAKLKNVDVLHFSRPRDMPQIFLTLKWTVDFVLFLVGALNLWFLADSGLLLIQRTQNASQTKIEGPRNLRLLRDWLKKNISFFSSKRQFWRNLSRKTNTAIVGHIQKHTWGVLVCTSYVRLLTARRGINCNIGFLTLPRHFLDTSQTLWRHKPVGYYQFLSDYLRRRKFWAYLIICEASPFGKQVVQTS